MTLLDPDGGRARTATADAGLIAATGSSEQAPAWVVTGTDVSGVQLAAADFDEAALHGRFALAVLPQGAVPLPVEAASTLPGAP